MFLFCVSTVGGGDWIFDKDEWGVSADVPHVGTVGGGVEVEDCPPVMVMMFPGFFVAE